MTREFEESFQNYLRWLAERGIRYPVLEYQITPPNPHYDMSSILFIKEASTQAPHNQESLLLDKIIASVGGNTSNPTKIKLIGYDEFLNSEKSFPAAKYLILLGINVYSQIFGRSNGFERSLGRLMAFPQNKDIEVMTIHHPRDLLANSALKRPTWEGLKLLIEKLSP